MRGTNLNDAYYVTLPAMLIEADILLAVAIPRLLANFPAQLVVGIAKYPLAAVGKGSLITVGALKTSFVKAKGFTGRLFGRLWGHKNATNATEVAINSTNTTDAFNSTEAVDLANITELVNKTLINNYNAVHDDEVMDIEDLKKDKEQRVLIEKLKKILADPTAPISDHLRNQASAELTRIICYFQTKISIRIEFFLRPLSSGLHL